MKHGIEMFFMSWVGFSFIPTYAQLPPLMALTCRNGAKRFSQPNKFIMKTINLC